MTLDECRAALEAAETTPTAALHAAVGLAGELAPDVAALLACAAADEPLLLQEERVVRYGLAALAAGRRTEVFPALCALLAQSPPMLPRMLAGGLDVVVPSLLTSLFDGDAERLALLLRDPGAPPDLRDALFLALAWLVRAGQAERAVLIEALERFEREDPPPPDDPAWHGWLGAARALGLDAWEEQVRQRLAADPPDWMDEAVRGVWRRELESAGRPDVLDVAAPIEDPATTFDPPVPPLAPAYPTDLSAEEGSWLESLLLALGLEGAAMPLEAVDGYFTALHVTPDEADFAACEPGVWRGAAASERFARAEVAAAARVLLARHFASVGTRLAAGEPTEPLFEMNDAETDGKLWAGGFFIGLERQQATWDRLMRRPAVRDLMEPLILLMGDPDAEGEANVAEDGNDAADDDDLSPELRATLLDHLPAAMLRLYQLVRGIPLRPDARVGRNDPCPCGSGRKYKKCCGAPGAVPAF